MQYRLMDCRTGEKPVYRTFLDITENEQELRFCFTAENAYYYCPYKEYNQNHYEGDVCEVFIGTASNPYVYYEIEVTPDNGLFFAQITHMGMDKNGNPSTAVDLIDKSNCFVRSSAQKAWGGYLIEIVINKYLLNPAGEPLVFNAFRIETDGGQRDKHLFALNPTLCSAFHVPEAFLFLNKQ